MSTSLNIHKLKADEYQDISLTHPKERKVFFCLSRWKQITFHAQQHLTDRSISLQFPSKEYVED
jgi:hypothetical protein